MIVLKSNSWPDLLLLTHTHTHTHKYTTQEDTELLRWNTMLSSPPLSFICSPSFPGGSDGKETAYSAGNSSSIPGSGRSPEEGNGTHGSILAWRSPWTEELDGLQSMGSQSVTHDWATNTSLHFTRFAQTCSLFFCLLLIQLRHQSEEVFPDTPSPWPGKTPLLSTPIALCTCSIVIFCHTVSQPLMCLFSRSTSPWAPRLSLYSQDRQSTWHINKGMYWIFNHIY